jgi:hypothetical protein
MIEAFLKSPNVPSPLRRTGLGLSAGFLCMSMTFGCEAPTDTTKHKADPSNFETEHAPDTDFPAHCDDMEISILHNRTIQVNSTYSLEDDAKYEGTLYTFSDDHLEKQVVTGGIVKYTYPQSLRGQTQTIRAVVEYSTHNSPDVFGSPDFCEESVDLPQAN